ncbi:hypothetical protein ACNRD9_08870, partial [Ralstonia pseudosolanacearum]
RVTEEDTTDAAVLHRGSTGDAVRLLLFSVQDHDPDGPRSLTQLHADVIAQARHVEALGYGTFRVAGHRFHMDGAVPKPEVFPIRYA